MFSTNIYEIIIYVARKWRSVSRNVTSLNTSDLWLNVLLRSAKILSSFRKVLENDNPYKNPFYLQSFLLEALESFQFDPQKSNLCSYPYTYSGVRCRNNYFKTSDIPYFASEWNKLKSKISNSFRYDIFRKPLTSFIRPSCKPIFPFENPVNLLLSLRLVFGCW